MERGDLAWRSRLAPSRRQAGGSRRNFQAASGPKAFRFYQKLKLEEEANALAATELQKAEQENKPANKARWLELLGKKAEAAALWEAADRNDKAYPLYEEPSGTWPRPRNWRRERAAGKKALDLYRKLGDAEARARVEAMPAGLSGARFTAA